MTQSLARLPPADEALCDDLEAKPHLLPQHVGPTRNGTCGVAVLLGGQRISTSHSMAVGNTVVFWAFRLLMEGRPRPTARRHAHSYDFAFPPLLASPISTKRRMASVRDGGSAYLAIHVDDDEVDKDAWSGGDSSGRPFP
jgi:hypothetical protein